MSDHMELSEDCEAGEVRACRGCLAVRCKLYDIREKRLEQVFSDLTGLPVSGGLLCSMCLHLVYKFKAFRVRCRYSGHILNHMFSLNEDSLSSIDRSNLRVPLSRSRMLNVNLESTRELSRTDVLHIIVQDDNETSDLENEFKSEDSVVKVENIENLTKLDNLHKIQNNVENVRFDDVEMASLMDNDANELTDVFANEIDFTDLTEKDDYIDDNVDDDTNEYYTETVKEKKTKRTKPKFEKDKAEMCKYFLDIWKAVKKENGDLYEMFDRLYKFSLIKERPVFPRVFRKKEKKSEVYNFIKFLDLFKEIADIYKVDVEFISIIEERRAMEVKRKALAEDSDYCGMCCKKYITAGTRDRHMKLAHNESLPFRCEVCLYTFKRESFFMMHLFKFHCTKKKCRECDQAIVTVGHKTQWNEVQLHIEMYHRRTLTTCEYCGRTFTAAKHCYYHIRQAHRGEMNAVQCLLCGDSYNGPLGLRGHVRKIHTEAVRCTTCDMFFQNKDIMATHVSETGECRKDVSGCPMCGATFSTESLMKQHYDDTHAKYKCERCIRTFIEYDSYKVHYYKICSDDGRRLPTQKSETAKAKKGKKKTNKTAPKKKQPIKDSNRIFICDVCGKDFNMRANLLYHIRIHTGEKPYKCEQCGKTFRMSNSLQMHSWTHTGERRYKCQYCPKAFRQQGHLKAHMPSHTNEKNYACDMCKKRFTARRTLKQHVQSVHEGLPLPPRIRRQKKPAEREYDIDCLM